MVSGFASAKIRKSLHVSIDNGVSQMSASCFFFLTLSIISIILYLISDTLRNTNTNYILRDLRP